MSNQKRITESIRVLATLYGDTNAALGAALGMSESSAAGKRTGRIRWSLQDVETLSARYGVSVDQLMAGPWAWLGLPEGGHDLAHDATGEYYPEALAA
jgi:BetR domain